jgi:hypothetical protein
MTLSLKTQHKQYELSLLSKIFKSKNFFICMLNDQYQTDYFDLKKDCLQHQIQLKIFKNNILQKALENTNWAILKKCVFGTLVVGYNLDSNKIYSKSELEHLFKSILQNKSIGFLAGFFYPMLLNQSLMKDLLSYSTTLIKDMQILNSLKFKVATNLFFVKKSV